ncbi:MAG: (2Fe-2S)-binding protein [Acidobacteria bacterium]|nr:(2Fe-2S)-binding protein [Acidobacteriota bacterium]
MSVINLKVNGRTHSIDVDPETPLLYILRNDLVLNGPKFGCGLGQCGACTVIVEGEAIRSCITAVGLVEGFEITTLEGIGTPEKPHPIQQAWIQEQAIQCGMCMNGHIMNAKALLDRIPHPTEAEIRQGLEGILCRCGTYYRVIRAVKRAGEIMLAAGVSNREVIEL